jgi:hypothetical protein
MRWTVEPRTDPSPVGYFWSHQVGLHGGGAAYCGLQTMGAEPTGKIAIFSVWDAMDCEGPEHARPFGGEGEGMSVRIRYEWRPGQAEHLSIRASGDGWWRADVGGRLIGMIRVDPDWGGLTSTSMMWTERYAPPLRCCQDMGHSVVRFGTPSAEDGITPRSHHNNLGQNRGCPGSFVGDDDEDGEGGIIQIMGASH